MHDGLDKLRENLQARLDERGMSPRALSLAIGKNHSYVSQILNGKGGQPAVGALQAMARELDTTTEYLLGDTSDPRQVSSEVSVQDVPEGWTEARPREDGIPLVGTGDCADLVITDESGTEIEIDRASFDPDYHVRYIARPPALRGARGVYAIYFHGDSMEPRFYAGEIGIVEPNRPARIGDYVLAQLRERDGDDVTSVLVKKLVGRRGGKIVLEQYNPRTTFELPAERVKHLHVVLSPSAWLGV